MKPVVLVILVAVADLAGAAEETTCDLIEFNWSLRIWGRTIEGIACILAPTPSWLRVEVARAPATGADLVARAGEGWTVALAGGGEATVGAWNERWRKLADDLLLRTRILAAVGGAGSEWAREAIAGIEPDALVDAPLRSDTGWRAGPKNGDRRECLELRFPGPTRRGAIRSDSQTSTLRRRLVARGTGRGAAEELWTFTWLDTGAFSLVSSRRSGRLVLRETGRREVRIPLPEGFLPLWSLETLVIEAR